MSSLRVARWKGLLIRARSGFVNHEWMDDGSVCGSAATPRCDSHPRNTERHNQKPNPTAIRSEIIYTNSRSLNAVIFGKSRRILLMFLINFQRQRWQLWGLGLGLGILNSFFFFFDMINMLKCWFLIRINLSIASRAFCLFFAWWESLFVAWVEMSWETDEINICMDIPDKLGELKNVYKFLTFKHFQLEYNSMISHSILASFTIMSHAKAVCTLLIRQVDDARCLLELNQHCIDS